MNLQTVVGNHRITKHPECTLYHAASYPVFCCYILLCSLWRSIRSFFVLAPESTAKNDSVLSVSSTSMVRLPASSANQMTLTHLKEETNKKPMLLPTSCEGGILHYCLHFFLSFSYNFCFYLDSLITPYSFLFLPFPLCIWFECGLLW